MICALSHCCFSTNPARPDHPRVCAQAVTLPVSVHAMFCAFNLKEQDACAGSVTAEFNMHGVLDGFVLLPHPPPIGQMCLGRQRPWPAFCTLLCSAVQFGSHVSSNVMLI